MLASLVDRNHTHPFPRQNEHEHLMLSGLQITTVTKYYTPAQTLRLMVKYIMHDIEKLLHSFHYDESRANAVADFKCLYNMTPCQLHLNTSLQDKPYLHGRSE